MSQFPFPELLVELSGHLSGAGAVRAEPVAGGSMAATWCLADEHQRAFLKLDARVSGMLAGEADGLRALARARAVRVPAVLGHGVHAGREWLLTEWLTLGGLDPGAWERFGEQLAQQHNRPAETFGWHRDNHIGATPQPNPQGHDWAAFFRRARLGHQLALARTGGLPAGTEDAVRQVMDRLEDWLAADISPSLLHGDLWSGNVAAAGGEPVIYDPAVYCGDSDADLAMLELFGAPPEPFWQGYRRHRRIREGYDRRRSLYNLYHLLNHFNLFGGAYASSVDRTCRQLLEMNTE